ncbi:MAG TPA: GNAT family N-acetyltransferase [Gemmatimonadaceae bacterium]|nr:GNAT family N-acetyltransferase [Gemmatimonadaceae bacterium]
MENIELPARTATDADIPELVRVINAAYRVEDFFIDGDRTDADDIRERMADPSMRIIVVDRDNSPSLAGCVLIDVHDNRGHFAMLSVDPLLQGRGVARILLNAVEEYCRSLGCKALDLEIVDLREELPAFYERLGFKAVSTAPFPQQRKLTRPAHLVIMSKTL